MTLSRVTGSRKILMWKLCIEDFHFFKSSCHQQMFCFVFFKKIKLWDRIYIIQENSQSWCGLTVCESGRWETVHWVKPPSVMCLLCYFFFWQSCRDNHKQRTVPWTPCVLKMATFPSKYSALHHPFFFHYHLLCSHFKTLHYTVYVTQRRNSCVWIMKPALKALN